MSRIVFRADGARAIGSGHVMRSLALAAEFQAGGWTVGFAATAETFATVPSLVAAKVEKLMLPQQAEGEADALARHWPTGADIFVVDHYGRDAAFELACRPWAGRIVVLDDLADRRHDADVLVDGANPEAAYRTLVPDTCEVLAGANFAILNPQFRRVRGQALAGRGERPVKRVLVSFGQIDPPNATMRALAALAKAGFSGHVDVVLGPAAPHLSEVRAAAKPDVQVHVGTDEMAKLMTDADLAIGAGGVTTWERCCLGLPSIIVALAENQRQTIAVVTKAGAGIDAGPLDAEAGERLNRILREVLGDAGRRIAIGRAAAGLVDGEGARRVMLAAIGPVPAKPNKSVRLRLASLDDESWLLALQRKPETRRFANDPAAPSADDHHRWLDATLSDPQRLLTIVEVEGRRAAMLRLDSGVDADRINIAVDPNYHRQGIGAAALELAARLLPGRTLEAEILSENAASLALFLGAGYRRDGERLFRRGPA